MLFIHSIDPSVLTTARQHCDSSGLAEHVLGDAAAVFASERAVLRVLRNGDVILAKGEHATGEQLKGTREACFDERGTFLTNGQEISSAHAVIYVGSDMVKACCDPLGIFPLFAHQTDETVLISDRLSLFTHLLDLELDPAGFMEFMRFGYFIGNRTPLRNVHRLRAGETVSTSLRNRKGLTSARRQIPWAPEPRGLLAERTTSLDEITDLLVEGACVPDGSMLMMSAGWDSRTVLAALLARGTKDVLLYNHGGSGSRESLIVQRICRDLGLHLTQVPLSTEIFRPQRLTEYSSRHDNVLFPHWHAAGLYAESQGRPTVLSGVLGEVLGGHYGAPMLMSGLKKVIAVALYLSLPALAQRLFNTGLDGQKVAARRLRQRDYQPPWYINEQVWQELFCETASDVNSDIERELTFYRDAGIVAPEALLECFITNQRAAQYICAQILSCINNSVSASLPFAGSRLMEVSSRIPFQDKVHNRLNRQIIRRLAPKLLDYPTAATLVSTRWPVPLQEASRLLRRTAEQLRWKAHGAAPQLLNAPNLGWANFQFMDTAFFGEVVDSLRLSVFDKPAMKRVIGAREHRPNHPIWDMLGKMKTLDNMVSGPA